MKKLLLIAFVAMAIAGKTRAQLNTPLAVDKMQSLHISQGFKNDIHTRAMRDFLKNNETVADVQWLIVDNGYVVKYTVNHMKCRSVYNKKGDWVYTIRQYGEYQMPRDVRALVKSSYYDYTIFLVEEIHHPLQSIVYLVHLEDTTTLKNLRVSNLEMEVVADYIKGNAGLISAAK